MANPKLLEAYELQSRINGLPDGESKAEDLYEMLDDVYMVRHNCALEYFWYCMGQDYKEDIRLSSWLNGLELFVDNPDRSPWTKTPDILLEKRDELGKINKIIISDITVTANVQKGYEQKMDSYYMAKTEVTRLFDLDCELYPISLEPDLAGIMEAIERFGGDVNYDLFATYSETSVDLTAMKGRLRSKLIPDQVEISKFHEHISKNYGDAANEETLRKMEDVCDKIIGSNMHEHPRLHYKVTPELIEKVHERVRTKFVEGPPDLAPVNEEAIEEAFQSAYKEMEEKYEHRDRPKPSMPFTFGNYGLYNKVDDQDTKLSDSNFDTLVKDLRNINVSEQIPHDQDRQEYARNVISVILKVYATKLPDATVKSVRQIGVALAEKAHINLKKNNKAEVKTTGKDGVLIDNMNALKDDQVLKCLPVWDQKYREECERWFKGEASVFSVPLRYEVELTPPPPITTINANDKLAYACWEETADLVRSFKSTQGFKFLKQASLNSKSLCMLQRQRDAKSCHVHNKGDLGLTVISLPHRAANENDSNGVPFVNVSYHLGEEVSYRTGFINEELVYIRLKVREGLWITISRPMRLNIKRLQVLTNASRMYDICMTSWMVTSKLTKISQCQYASAMIIMMILSQNTRTCGILENLRYIFMDSTAKLANLKQFMSDTGAFAIKNRLQVLLFKRSHEFAHAAYQSIQKSTKNKMEVKEDLQSINFQKSGIKIKIQSFLQDDIIHESLEHVTNEIYGLYFIIGKGLQEPHHRDIKLQTTPIEWEMKLKEQPLRNVPYGTFPYPQFAVDEELVLVMAEWGNRTMLQPFESDIRNKIANLPWDKNILELRQFGSTKACLKRGEESKNHRSKVITEFLYWVEEEPKADWSMLGFTLRVIMEEIQFWFGISAKGQRTIEDREFYVGSLSTFALRAMEMVMRCVGEVIPGEVISVSGDRKFSMMQDNINAVMKWAKKQLASRKDYEERSKGMDELREAFKGLERTVEDQLYHDITTAMDQDSHSEGTSSSSDLGKHIEVCFQNADRTKWSAGDLTSKYYLFLSQLTVIPDEIRSIMMYILDMHMKKNYIMSEKIHERLKNARAKHEKADNYLKFMDEEMFCKMSENWCQGMINLMSSVFQAISERFIIHLFKTEIRPNTPCFVVDLVHSDDSALITAFLSDDSESAYCADLYFKFDSEIGQAFCMWYNRKKTNLHALIAEFLSTVSIWGQQSYPWSKILISIIAGLPGTGLADDMYAGLAQIMGAGMKGAPMSILQHAIDIVHDRVSEIYGTGPKGHNDVEAEFGVPKEWIPLELGGKFLPCATLLCLAGPAVHDVMLCYLYNRGRLDRLPFSDKLAKLLVACSPSGIMADTVDPADALQFDSGFSGPIFKSNIDLKDEITKKKIEYLAHVKCVDNKILDAWDFGHPDREHVPMHEMSNLVMSMHSKMQKHSIRRAFASSTMTNVEVQRARYVKGAHVKAKPWDAEWRTLKEVLQDINEYSNKPMTNPEMIIIQEISRTFAIEANAYIAYIDTVALSVKSEVGGMRKTDKVMPTMSQKLPYPAQVCALYNSAVSVIIREELPEIAPPASLKNHNFFEQDIKYLRGKYISPFEHCDEFSKFIYIHAMLKCREGHLLEESVMMAVEALRIKYGVSVALPTDEDLIAIHKRVIQLFSRIKKAFSRKRGDRWVITESGAASNRVTLDRFIKYNTLVMKFVIIDRNAHLTSWDLSTADRRSMRETIMRYRDLIRDMEQLYKFTVMHLGSDDYKQFWLWTRRTDNTQGTSIYIELLDLQKEMLTRTEKYNVREVGKIGLILAAFKNDYQLLHKMHNIKGIKEPVFTKYQQIVNGKWTGDFELYLKSGRISMLVNGGDYIRFAQVDDTTDPSTIRQMLKVANKTIDPKRPIDDMSHYSILVASEGFKRECFYLSHNRWFWGRPKPGDKYLDNVTYRKHMPDYVVTTRPHIKLTSDKVEAYIRGQETDTTLIRLESIEVARSLEGKVNINIDKPMITKDGIRLDKLSDDGDKLIRLVSMQGINMSVKELVNVVEPAFWTVNDNGIQEMSELMRELCAGELPVIRFLKVCESKIHDFRGDIGLSNEFVGFNAQDRRQINRPLIILDDLSGRMSASSGGSTRTEIDATSSKLHGSLMTMVITALGQPNIGMFNPYRFGVLIAECLKRVGKYDDFNRRNVNHLIYTPTSDAAIILFNIYCNASLKNIGEKYLVARKMKMKECLDYMTMHNLRELKTERDKQASMAGFSRFVQEEVKQLIRESRGDIGVNTSELPFTIRAMDELFCIMWGKEKKEQVFDADVRAQLIRLGFNTDYDPYAFPPLAAITEENVGELGMEKTKTELAVMKNIDSLLQGKPEVISEELYDKDGHRLVPINDGSQAVDQTPFDYRTEEALDDDYNRLLALMMDPDSLAENLVNDVLDAREEGPTLAESIINHGIESRHAVRAIDRHRDTAHTEDMMRAIKLSNEPFNDEGAGPSSDRRPVVVPEEPKPQPKSDSAPGAPAKPKKKKKKSRGRRK